MNSTRKSGWRKANEANERKDGKDRESPRKRKDRGEGMEACGYGRKYAWTEERKDRRIKKTTQGQ